MYNALEQESNNKYDLIIHSSAVGDYKPEFSFRLEDLAEELAIAMSKTASSAESVGSSFENTTAMLAVMIETTRESA